MKTPPTTNNNPVRNLDDQIRNKVIAKENEIEQIDKIYEKRINDANTRGDDRYVEAIDRNNRKLIEENKDYEERLKNYQTSLTQTKKIIDQSREKAIADSKEEQNTLRASAEDKYSRLYEHAKENQDSILEKTHQDSKKLSEKSLHDKNMHESKNHQTLATFSANLLQNTHEQEENLKKQLESEQAATVHTLNQNKIEAQAQLIDNDKKNKRLEAEQKRVQTEEMQFQDKYHAELLRIKDEDFKKRYEKMASEHQEILNTLKAKLDKTTKNAIEANSRDMKAIHDANSDPFYQLEILKPTMDEDQKNYYVHLEVPAHEKEDVHLLAHGRELKLTFSKKFMTTITTPDGSENHVSKTQLFSKEFPTADILDPKHVSQKYEDGILSFKIAKL